MPGGKGKSNLKSSFMCFAGAIELVASKSSSLDAGSFEFASSRVHQNEGDEADSAGGGANNVMDSTCSMWKHWGG